MAPTATEREPKCILCVTGAAGTPKIKPLISQSHPVVSVASKHTLANGLVSLLKITPTSNRVNDPGGSANAWCVFACVS